MTYCCLAAVLEMIRKGKHAPLPVQQYILRDTVAGAYAVRWVKTRINLVVWSMTRPASHWCQKLSEQPHHGHSVRSCHAWLPALLTPAQGGQDAQRPPVHRQTKCPCAQ